jgi:hypothetical protein
VSALKIDGKAVRIFLFARRSELSDHPVLAQVEAFNKDHAIQRLVEYSSFATRHWDFIEELDPEHDVGKMGFKLPLNPLVIVRGNLSSH